MACINQQDITGGAPQTPADQRIVVQMILARDFLNPTLVPKRKTVPMFPTSEYHGHFVDARELTTGYLAGYAK